MKTLSIQTCNQILVLLWIHVTSISSDTQTTWSECSRSCDTGLANRTVSCLQSDQSCNSGIKYEYKLCNKEPCLETSVDLRSEQCAVYNVKPFRGVIHQWIPVLDPLQPCALLCKTKETQDWLHNTFSDKVADGTKCKDGANDVCINGQCLPIGCDDIVGYDAVNDNCRSRINYGWLTAWSPCSTSCGTGYQKTNSTCIEVNTGKHVVNTLCDVDRIPHEMTRECFSENCTEIYKDILPPCEGGACPEWITQEWSLCPVTCGQGYQFRQVDCKNGGCSEKTKPMSKRVCITSTPCEEPIALVTTTADGYEDDEVADGESFTIPRYVSGNWSVCNTTCGDGVKTRMIYCQIFNNQTEQVEILSDQECGDQTRPAEIEECSTMAECDKTEIPDINPMSNQTNSTTYEWKIGNYSACSSSCLAGEEYPNLMCVNGDGSSVSSSYCSDIKKPVIKPRVCNDIPCPPRWEIGEYGMCTAECGGGIQQRPVQCIEELSKVSRRPVETFRCPDPIPMSERSCNTQFCPSRWMTRDWSECSSSCGVGLQTRRAYCIKSPIQGRQVTVSDTECMGPKPMTSRECHTGNCFDVETPPPVIKSENYTYVQFRRSKRLKLIIGGEVVLLPGQSVIIKCPVKNYQRKLIFWSKGYKLIPMAGRVQTTFSGNLRIRKTEPAIDTGSYTCIAGMQSADIEIKFQSKRDAIKQAREMQQLLTEANSNANLNLPLKDEASGPGVIRDPHYNATKQLVFTPGRWSACSKTCGSGHQTRKAKCTRITFKYMKMLDDRECLKRGLVKPVEIQKCLIQEDCPNWEIGKWSRCKKDQCVRDGYAQRKRAIHCNYSNGTRASLDVCHALERPEHKKECRSFDCYSVWKTSKWTECFPRCAKKGYKSRTLTCLWKRSKKPAWSSCKAKPRPITKKTCRPKPCLAECEDKSRYCNLVGMLKMCRYSNFRYNCCGTCQDYMKRNS
ncbi:hypothetical protein SNE40_012222 [Patella caerulea]|uniref:Uncharacterized protein n=1 Tax=Patella caerulea TaxID=87958 RepID=A0AAN8JPY6_PATCE